MSMYMKFIAPIIILVVAISKGKLLEGLEGMVYLIIAIGILVGIYLCICKIFKCIRSFIKKLIKC